MKQLFLFICVTYTLLSVSYEAKLYGQEIKITITNLETVNNKLVITYDFAGEEIGKYFDVWVEITTLQGNRINARSLSGDFGDNLKASKSRKIFWDYVADEIILDEEINIEVKALPSRPVQVVKNKTSNGSAILMSAIFPGLGLSKIDKGKPYWLMGAGTYLLAGSSVILNKKANTEYESYKTDFNQESSDESLKKSKSFNSMSKIAAYSALGLWTINMIWTISKSKKDQPISISLKRNKKVLFYTYYDFGANAQQFMVCYSF